MPRTRIELEEIERRNLAPYAQLSADTRGRKYKEAEVDELLKRFMADEHELLRHQMVDYGFLVREDGAYRLQT